MMRAPIIIVLAVAAVLTVASAAIPASEQVWLWGFELGQPYNEVADQLRLFDTAQDTDTGGKLFSRDAEWVTGDKSFAYSLIVEVAGERVVTILLLFHNASSAADRAFLTDHLLERFKEQGLEFESLEESWMHVADGFSASVSVSEGTVGAMLMSTNRPEATKPSGSERSEFSLGITPKEAQSLVKKSKAYFKKHYIDSIRFQSAYTARRIEYARFGKAVVYSEATLDQRFAVVKYSRTRHGCGMWCWRFVRATEIIDDAPDAIVAVEVWNTRECPLTVRNFESYMYWSSDVDLWSYTDPAEYVNWWSYIGFVLFHYPLDATVYFSPYHPGILDEYNEYHGNGIYDFTPESIEHAGVVASVSL